MVTNYESSITENHIAKKILVTGSAGFIGSALTIRLLERGDEVIGIDNHNNYYEPTLKEARLARHVDHSNYTHLRIDISDSYKVKGAFSEHKPQIVVNLAAQAGVRYSIENPLIYVDSNIVGFTNILEGCRKNKVQHLVYASSSSVYGSNTKLPFSTTDNVDNPLSIYAATKKTNELMCHVYSHLFNLPATGLRLFTVYGPWDRPDMAMQKFAHAILSGEKIQIYNYGKHRRDYTYIDDITECIVRVLDNPPISKQNITSRTLLKSSSAIHRPPYKIYNIGGNNPIELIDFIEALEKALGKKAKKEFLPMQPGDVRDTHADIDDLVKDFHYKPSMQVSEGIKNFVEWFKSYNT